MHSSSTNENITSSGIVYPFPPYVFPFSSSSSSSSHNLQHHLHPHQENTTNPASILRLHQDQIALMNNCLHPSPEISMLNLGGASSKAIMSSSQDYHQHYVYDNRIGSNIGHQPYLANKEAKVPPFGVKKDRRRKIFTAQGLRDRRVRLSIDVARDFFDLQDLLGFDKASQTLEWLLSKSRSAIIDLAKSKCNDNSISPSLSSSNTTENDGVSDTSNEVKLRRKMKEDVAKMKRALRVKARARARERTIEKKSSNTTYNTSKMIPQVCSSHLSLFNELNPADMNEELGSALVRDNQEHIELQRKMNSPPPSGSSRPDQIPTNMSWETNAGVFTFPSFSAITTNYMNLNSNGSFRKSEIKSNNDRL